MPAWTCYNTQAAFHSLSSVAHPAVAASTLIVEAQGAWSTVRIQSLDPFQAPYATSSVLVPPHNASPSPLRCSVSYLSCYPFEFKKPREEEWYGILLYWYCWVISYSLPYQHTHTHTHIHARLPGVLLFVSSRPSVAGSSFSLSFLAFSKRTGKTEQAETETETETEQAAAPPKGKG